MNKDITDEEWGIITERRESIQQRRKILEKRDNCSHKEQTFRGHGHNYAIYECDECGEYIHD